MHIFEHVFSGNFKQNCEKLWGNWKKWHYFKSGPFFKQQKALKPSLLEEFVSVLAAWLQKAHANNVSHDVTNNREKTLPITTRFQIDRSMIFSGWINRFKKRHDTDTRTLVGESWCVDSESTYDWKNEWLL